MNSIRKNLMLVLWGLSVAAASLVLIFFLGLHLFDQVFWRYYYSNVVQFGDRCVAGIGEWPGSVENALTLPLKMQDAPMPHRGTANPPRAFLHQFLRVDCVVPLNLIKPDSYPTISLGQLYGGSVVFWNGTEILNAPSGQMVEFPLPPSNDGPKKSYGTVTVISRGMEDGSVGMATLRPPYLAPDQKDAQLVRRFLSSVYSEQPVFRMGIAGIAMVLLAALWWFGIRYPDVIWIMTLAGCMCIAAGFQYSLAFNFSWKPWAERFISVTNFAVMYAQAMFVWVFIRSRDPIPITIKGLQIAFGFLIIVTLTCSDRTFYDWRLLVKTPSLFGIGAIAFVLIDLTRQYRAKDIILAKKVRMRTAFVLGIATLILYSTQWFLDEVHGIYIHYQVQMFTLLAFCGVLLRDLAYRQHEYFVERSQRQAEEQKNTRAKAIAETARFIAHDLQRPFQIVKMFMERVATIPASEIHTLTSTFQSTLKNAESDAHQLIQDLMAFGSQPQYSASEFSLRDCVDEALRLVSLQSNSIQTENQISPNLKMLGRRGDISRAFQNLVQNAVEAIPGNGRIEASAEVLSENRCRLTIFNSDSFVNESDRERIFELAYTAGKPNGKGLGLAFVRKVMEQHGGTIQCISSSDGTQFVIDLPLVAENERQARLRVALVDDDLLVHMAWSLDQPGLGLSCFDDPAIFLANMEFKADELAQFQVIIMDYRFRNNPQSGIHYAEQLKRIKGCPPIFLATQVAIAIPNNGALDGIIEKRPMSSDSLRQLIKT